MGCTGWRRVLGSVVAGRGRALRAGEVCAWRPRLEAMGRGGAGRRLVGEALGAARRQASPARWPLGASAGRNRGGARTEQRRVEREG